MNKLILIDGNAIMHRAFHALPFLNSKDGQPTNAVYGFILILFKIIENLKPDYLAVCFDKKAPTFRKKLFKDYQIKRPEMDKNLVPQIDLMHKVINSMKIPIYEKDGFEADDTLATLTLQAQAPNPKHQISSKSKSLNSKKHAIDEVVIVTGDRDLLQLASDKVKLFMPVKGLVEGKLFGIEETKERMGVYPNLIPDFKALAGDQSDNYPGVDGIGPKTAINLINEFGSLEKIYKNLDLIKNKAVKEKLIKDKKNAYLSYELATIIKNVPIKFDLNIAKLHNLDTREAIEIFGKLGFKKLLQRLLTIGKPEIAEVVKIKETVKKNPEKQMELF